MYGVLNHFTSYKLVKLVAAGRSTLKMAVNRAIFENCLIFSIQVWTAFEEYGDFMAKINIDMLFQVVMCSDYPLCKPKKRQYLHGTFQSYPPASTELSTFFVD